MLPRNRRIGWGIGVGVIIALLWIPCMHANFSIRLALDLNKLAAGAPPQKPSIKQAKIRSSMGGVNYEALLYCPAGSLPKSAVVLVAGLSELGCYHPRAVAMARLLADKGMLVITPDIKEFRDFQITAKPIEQILFWHGQIGQLKEGSQIRIRGVGGISFSGTLALMAAANSRVRDSMGFAVAIGPYSNLMRCTKGWFAAAPRASGPYYPTRFYAKWIIMRSALNMIMDPKEKLLLRGVLDNLLLQKPVPSAPAQLSGQAARWYRLATMAETETDAGLTNEIESYLTSRVYPELDPAKALKEIRCPVFLVHGEYDDLIPAQESIELNRKIAGSHLLISPFLTHTHPSDTPLSIRRKIGAASDALLFFYQFAQAVQ